MYLKMVTECTMNRPLPLNTVSLVVVYLFQHSKQNMQVQRNKFNKARQQEWQMPIMLATYSTNIIIVSETIC